MGVPSHSKSPRFKFVFRTLSITYDGAIWEIVNSFQPLTISQNVPSCMFHRVLNTTLGFVLRTLKLDPLVA